MAFDWPSSTVSLVTRRYLPSRNPAALAPLNGTLKRPMILACNNKFNCMHFDSNAVRLDCLCSPERTMEMTRTMVRLEVCHSVGMPP